MRQFGLVAMAGATAVLLTIGVGTSSAAPAPRPELPPTTTLVAPTAGVKPTTAAAAEVYGPFRIQSKQSQRCITNPAMSHAEGRAMIQWDCNNGVANDQKWLLRSTTVYGLYEVINAESGKCLGVPEGTDKNGTQLIQWTCRTAADQYWYLLDGYRFQNWDTGQQIGLGAGSGNGVPIVQNYGCGCADQYWAVEGV